MRTPRTVLAASAIAAIAAAAAIPATAAAGTDTSALRQVTLGGGAPTKPHSRPSPTRTAGPAPAGRRAMTPPSSYVEDHLIAAGYIVQRQNFDYEFFVVDAPPVIDPTSPDLPAYTPETEIYVMEYSGDGDVTAPVTPVDLVLPPTSTPSSTSGCEASDFAGFPTGNIALIQRGTCTFRREGRQRGGRCERGHHLQRGPGGPDDVIFGTLDPPQVSIPIMDASFDVGNELAGLAAGPARGPRRGRRARRAAHDEQRHRRVRHRSHRTGP